MFLFLLFSVAAFGSEPDLDGHWLQACQGAFQKREEFHGDKVRLVETNFIESDCRIPAIEVRSEGKFSLGLNLPMPFGARAMDFRFERVTITLRHERYLSYYAARSMCGINDWKIGEERDVTGLICDFANGGQGVQVPKAGDMRYGVYALDLVHGELYFGRMTLERNGLTPETRPQLWDPLPFVRER